MKANLTQQLQGVADALNLTPYGISHFIAAETDCSNRERMAIEKRWQRVLSGQNFRAQDIEADLQALGYSIKIEKQ